MKEFSWFSLFCALLSQQALLLMVGGGAATIGVAGAYLVGRDDSSDALSMADKFQPGPATGGPWMGVEGWLSE